MGLGEHVARLDSFRAHRSAFRGRAGGYPESVDGVSLSHAAHHSRSLWIWRGLGSSAGLFRPCGEYDRDYTRVFYRLRNLCGRRQPDSYGVFAPRTSQQRGRVCSPWRSWFLFYWV
jgi:hypothetical protein